MEQIPAHYAANCQFPSLELEVEKFPSGDLGPRLLLSLPWNVLGPTGGAGWEWEGDDVHILLRVLNPTLFQGCYQRTLYIKNRPLLLIYVQWSFGQSWVAQDRVWWGWESSMESSSELWPGFIMYCPCGCGSVVDASLNSPLWNECGESASAVPTAWWVFHPWALPVN